MTKVGAFVGYINELSSSMNFLDPVGVALCVAVFVRSQPAGI